MKDSESLQNHHLSQIRAIDKMHVEHLFMPDAVFTEEYLNSRHKQNQSQLQLNAADFERAQEVALKETLGGDQGRNKLAELALGQNSSLVENLKPILQYIDNLSGHALNFRNDQGELYIKEELIKWQDKTDEEDSTFSEQISVAEPKMSVAKGHVSTKNTFHVFHNTCLGWSNAFLGWPLWM